MKKNWLRGILLGLSMALLLTGGVALADRQPPAGVQASQDVHDVNLVTLHVDDDGGCTGEGDMWWGATGPINFLSYAYLLVGNATSLESGPCWAIWDGDWATTLGGDVTITEPGIVSDEDGFAQYDDGNDSSPLGLEVTQFSCAWADAPNDDFVLLRYVIKNLSGGALNGLYAGHLVDGDVGGSTTGDTTSYDASREMAYQWDNIWMGLRYVSGGVSAYNNMDAYVDNDSDAWTALSNGEFDATYTASNLNFVMGSGPFSLAPGEEYVLGTAWLGGSGLADLRNNADQALEMWEASEGCTVAPVAPAEFVPEPGSILLLGSGLAGLAGYATLRLRSGQAMRWRTRE